MLENIERTLGDAGLFPEFPLDTGGKRVRCKVDGDRLAEKSGWYILFEVRGESNARLYVGAYGNWRSGEKGKLFAGDKDESGRDPEISRRARENINKQIKADQARAEKRRDDAARRAALRSLAAWESLKPCDSHAYLARKRVGAYGLKVSAKGNLVVPMQNQAGEVVGLQVIYAEKQVKTGRDKTFWPVGVRKEGAFHLVGDFDSPAVIAICEGYATAATVHELVDLPVVVAFDAGNLLPVAKAIRVKYPDAQIIIGADDDWKTVNAKGELHNTGLVKAKGAAGAVGGKVLYPKFSLARGDKDTDWNDLFISHGPHVVRAQWDFLLRAQQRKAEIKRSLAEDGNKWLAGLRYNQNGTLSGDPSNIALILQNDEHWKGVIAFNEFAGRIEKLKLPPYPQATVGEWCDIDTNQSEIWFIREYGLAPKSDSLNRAISVIANENQFHPVRDYLNGLQWDGVMRLSRWMSTYLGVALTDYSMLVAVKWMVGAVARIFEPGCKNDNVLILEGLQGIGKSQLLKVLAVNPEWFSDTSFKLGDREAFLSIRGKWIIEMGELDSFNKAENTAAKLFFSGSEDHYRNPYDRYPRTVKRQCVFAGTTNEEAYLRDPTGNRRYWPNKCAGVDLDGLREVLDQLWAEAVSEYRAGTVHYVLNDERPLFTEQQSVRVEQDVWEEEVASFFEKNNNVNEFSLGEIMRDALQLRLEQIKRPEQMRVSGILKRLGWHRRQVKRAGQVYWVYVRPEVTE